MPTERDPDTCPNCGDLYAACNEWGAFKCQKCNHGWRVVPYSANACRLCEGATGKRVGIDREWVVCPVCHGTGSSDEVRGRSGQGGQCPGNREGVHTMIREDGPVGAKWKCKLCYVRW